MKRLARLAARVRAAVSSVRYRRLRGVPTPVEAMESRVHLDASAWLASGSAATYDEPTRTLTVTGAATINADPGSDLPHIVAGSPVRV